MRRAEAWALPSLRAFEGFDEVLGRREEAADRPAAGREYTREKRRSVGGVGSSLSVPFLLVGCLLFVAALAQRVGFSAPGLGLLLGSFAAVTAAILHPGRRLSDASRRLVTGLQGLVFGALLLGFSRVPGFCVVPASSALPFLAGPCVLAVVALDYSLRRLLPDAWRFPVALAGFALPALWMIHASPHPRVDVWSMQTEAAGFLLAGTNPYSQLYHNVYGHTAFLSDALIVDGKIRGFPYPPLTLWIATAGHALADVRVGGVLAIALAAWAMRAVGLRRGLPAGHPYELLPVCLLALPKTLLVVEMGWTDPYPAAAAVLLVASLGRSGRAARILALGLFAASKQYALLWVPLLWARRHVDARVVAWAALAALATALPFLLWDASALVHGLVVFQVVQVFRPDSLSLAAPLFTGLAWELPRWLPLLSAAVLSLWIARRREPSLALTTVGGALVYMGFFLSSPQAFVNYYWFCAVLLLLGTLLELCQRRDAAPEAETRSYAEPA